MHDSLIIKIYKKQNYKMSAPNSNFREEAQREMSTCKIMPFFIKRSGKEICHRCCYFVISLASCFLAIFVALIANTVISQSPLMFLKISEITMGEMDMTFSANQEGNNHYTRYINMTRIDDLIKDKVGELAPRLIFEGSSVSYKNRPADLTLMIIDTERERKQRIGTKYDFNKLNQGECIIPASIAQYLNITENEYLILNINMDSYYKMLETLYYGPTITPNSDFQEYNKMQNTESLLVKKIMTRCKVAHTFDSLGGKVPISNDDEYIIMELDSFLRFLADELSITDSRFKDFIRKFNSYQIISYGIRNHPDRELIYVDSDFENVQKVMAEESSKIMGPLGFYPIITNLPILKILIPLSMGAIFLRIILNLVVILLSVISTFLIYSLLTISVETRTFELGILRILGTNKFGLGFLVIVQAMLFVLPAFFLAILLSFPALAMISSTFEENLGFSFAAVPTPISFAWALGIGLLVPLAAAALPIKQVLGTGLVQALDTTRSKTQGVHITVEYQQKETSWGFVAFGVIMIIYGLSIYYFLPLSLLALDLQLMLWIMLSILLAIIVGLIIISLNIMHPLEKLLVYIFLFYEKASMKFLIIKNMIAHKFRNQRTGIIYSLSLGFLLFAVVSYTMELRNTQLFQLSKHGSYLECSWKYSTLNYKDAVELENILMVNYADIVEDFSWTSINIVNHGDLKIRDNWIADFGRLNTFVMRIQAVSPNYFNVANDIFISPFSSNVSSDISLSEQLYTTRGSQALGTGSFLEKELNIDPNDPESTFLLLTERSNTDIAMDFRALWLLNSCPGLQMSRIKKSWQSGIISIPLYLKLSNSTSISLAGYDTLSIKVKDSDFSQYNQVYSAINQYALQRNKAFTVWSYSKEVNSIDQIAYYLDVMFIVIIVFFMFLSFFSLSSSMTANILEQAKELSIVRSIGLSRGRTVLLHIYEAFTLVFSSSLIGAIIGMMVGYTLALQREVFSDLPVTFKFPYKHLIAMFATSLACAVLSTVSPSLYLLNKPISEIAKL